jgi:hypothetical protein
MPHAVEKAAPHFVMVLLQQAEPGCPNGIQPSPVGLVQVMGCQNTS